MGRSRVTPYPWDALPPSTGLSASPKMSGGRNLATVTRFCPCASQLVSALRSRWCFVGKQGAALPAARKDCGGRTRGPYGQSTLSSHYANLEPGANQAYPSHTTASQPGSQPFLHSAAPPALDGRSTPWRSQKAGIGAFLESCSRTIELAKTAGNHAQCGSPRELNSDWDCADKPR
jgi:hypothetical protein